MCIIYERNLILCFTSFKSDFFDSNSKRKYVCSLPNKVKVIMKNLVLLIFVLLFSCNKSGKIADLGGNLTAVDLKTGDGKEADEYDHVAVHYTGWVINDSTDLYADWSSNEAKAEDKFDSSYDRKNKFEFQLGYGSVIKGWDKGVLGMKEGGKRILIIPADLAYGKRSPSPKIPPNSSLRAPMKFTNAPKSTHFTTLPS